MTKLIYRGRLRELILFDDPMTGSTLSIKPHFTPQELTTVVLESRALFGIDWRMSYDFECPACGGQFIENEGRKGQFLLFRCPCGKRYQVKALRFKLVGREYEEKNSR